MLRILAVAAIGLGFGSLPFDWADQRRALALESSGRTVTVSEVRVHVGHRFARHGGGWDEVDRVQVRIPGVVGGAWVDVYGLNNLEMNPDVEGSLWRRGWQEPTGATTYRPPLEVVYRVGRNVDVMTPGDLARWTTSDDVEISAGIGASGLGLLALTLLPSAWRRHPPYRVPVTITLREITEDNAESVLALRTTPDQERFVSTVADSLAEADANPHGNPWFRAVYADGQPVGFVMLSWDVEPQPPEINGPWFLWKLLIDHRHQRKGYGQEVVRQVVELVRAHGGTELLTSYVPGDGGPSGFYTRLGFVPTGELDPEGEILLRRVID